MPDRGPFTNELSEQIWKSKYRLDGEASIEETWQRVATTLAAVESAGRSQREEEFLSILRDFRFLPGGRILAGCGNPHRVTLFNCFVMGTIEDSLDGIFQALKEGALTMQQGGGVGYDFSTLRPRGAPAVSAGTVASGPVSFMRVWDAMCATMLSTGARRGAMMATLRCDHPDVEEFIAAKHSPGELVNFNLSLLVTDELMAAIERDDEWPLVFPLSTDVGEQAGSQPADDRVLWRRWSGTDQPVPCRVIRVVPARRLWDRLMRSTYETAEPGVLFIDRINEVNNLAYREQISATNPCGEIPLPPYGACDLGSINLARFVRNPFSPAASLDLEGIRATARIAVRMLDNVIDASDFPLEHQAQRARRSRRVGLGITGLGDALILLGRGYASAEGREIAAQAMRTICHSAYLASTQIAEEKGPFPEFEQKPYLEGEFIAALPAAVREAIATHGIRNSHLTAIAPAGTISVLANNVSSGLEPVFARRYTRRVVGVSGPRQFEVTDDAVARWADLGNGAPPGDIFATAREIEPEKHLAMQAALQPFVDSAISKTLNIPENYPFESFRNLYRLAYERSLKGCTTFRPNPTRGSVLEAETSPSSAPHCCSLEREAD